VSTTGTAPQGPPEDSIEGKQVAWGSLRKVGFRLLFCYVVLFGMFCMNLGALMTIYFLTDRWAASPLDRWWGFQVSLVARYVFQLKNFKFQAISSGDSLSDYLQFFTYALIALLVALVWTLVRRKAANYSKLSQWLRLYAQLALGVTMMGYGLDKVVPLQFGELTASRLVGSVGDLTPFSMLWLFMATSKPYTIFSGVLETLAGVMLITPKLRSPGALLAVAVMTNVFALNVFYDVPVKSFSLQLLLLAIYLASPEFPRLVKMLVLNRTVQRRSESPLSRSTRVVKWAQLAQAGLAACFFALCLIGTTRRYAARQAETRDVPLFGVWEVDQFKLSGNSQPLFTDKLAAELHLRPGDDHWRKLVIERTGEAVLQLQSGVLDWVSFSLSKGRTELELSDSDDPKWKAHFAIQQQARNLLNLQGALNGVPVDIKLHVDERAFRLTSGEYHVIFTYE
jgi:uncharacterized membrane protein YphA (DoxX/SURF4 family)